MERTSIALKINRNSFRWIVVIRKGLFPNFFKMDAPVMPIKQKLKLRIFILNIRRIFGYFWNGIKKIKIWASRHVEITGSDWLVRPGVISIKHGPAVDPRTWYSEGFLGRTKRSNFGPINHPVKPTPVELYDDYGLPGPGTWPLRSFVLESL